MFKKKEAQNLIMCSNQELNSIYRNIDGPGLINLCMKRKKCHKILEKTRKLSIFYKKNPEKPLKKIRESLKTCNKNEKPDKKKWIEQMKIKSIMSEKVNEYFILKEIYIDYPDYFSHQIEVDLNRTFPNSSEKNKNLTKIQKMRNILLSYSKRNPFVGYCQGLNFIVEYLLRKEFEEEECYFTLIYLIEFLLPIDYYSTMTGVIVDQKIFDQMIDQYLPDLSNLFKKIEMDTSIFSIPWFVCLFTSAKIDEKILDIIWEHLIIEGSIALLKSGLVLLKIIKNKLIKSTNFVDALKIIEEEISLIKDNNNFNKYLNKIKICSRVFKIGQNKYRDNFLENKAETSKKIKPKEIKKQNFICNEKWPICIKLMESFKQNKPEIDFFIFRQSPNLDILIQNDYFQDIISKKPIPFISLKENIVIGRHFHNCVEEKIDKENYINVLEEKINRKKIKKEIKIFKKIELNDSKYMRKCFSCGNLDNLKSRSDSRDRESLNFEKEEQKNNFNLDFELFPRLEKQGKLLNNQYAWSPSFNFVKGLDLIKNEFSNE